MRRCSVFFLLLFWLSCYNLVLAQQQISVKASAVELDRYARITKTADGQRLNHSQELNISPDASQYQFRNQTNYFPAYTETDCQPVWKQGIMGTCIGSNSMTSKDIDNDGKTEIICSGGSYFGSGNFWYVLRYNPETQQYDQVWISPWYDNYSAKISVISVLDMNNDQVSEIFVGFTNGNIEVYNGESMALMQLISGISSSPVFQILWADADNDNQSELVYCSGGETWLLNSTDFSLKSYFYYGATSMRCGNVDADPSRELVYSDGRIVRITGQSANLIWTFYENSWGSGLVELTDLDGDLIHEIVYARAWNSIDVYDADIQSLKYQIPTDLDIDALSLADVDNDGLNEILYGDGQWGSVYCHNAANGQLMWSVDNPEHGTTAINVADTDNDGTLELVWGAGCSSSGSDYLFVHAIPSLAAEWKSKHIDGPFNAIRVADVDSDGRQEIITLSYESESSYESGIMSVFDAQTHQLEWQSDGNFFYGSWTGMYAFEVMDIDSDDIMEIVVAAGETYDGKIWVVNGLTYEIESEYEYYSEDIDAFHAFDIADVDGDGQPDFIAGNSDAIYIINPDDYAVKWSIETNTFSELSRVKAGNVDLDSNIEIVSCQGKISVTDGLTHQKWETLQSDFTSFDLHDYNNDGVKDIIASTINGSIGAIDGQSAEITWILTGFEARIDGVRMANIHGDETPEIVFTSGGSVFFSNMAGNILKTASFGTIAGAYNNIEVSDDNNDGLKEIFIGTNYQVVELGDDCFRCIDFAIQTGGENLSCGGGNDGSVWVEAQGGVLPYVYSWSTGDTTAGLQNLAPGNYVVTVTDNQGCSRQDEVTIIQSALIAAVNHTDVGCSGIDNGSVTTNIEAGSPPYTYLWNTGATQASLENLSVGTYTVVITDSKNCSAEFSVPILQDTVMVNLMPHNVSCSSENDGYVESWVTHGVPPFTFLWSNGSVNPAIYGLVPCFYSLLVEDSLLCSSSVTVEIIKPEGISATSATTTDNPDTGIPEGTATIYPTGGQPPYFIQWFDPFYQTSPTAINLISGEYVVRVRDINNCESYFTVFVGQTNDIPEQEHNKAFSLYPVPASAFVTLELAGNEIPADGKVTVYSLLGQKVLECRVTSLKTEIDISSLMPGIYLLQFKGNSLSGNHFIIKK